MSNTDFVDDDLVGREGSGTSPHDEGEEQYDRMAGAISRATSDLELTRMGQHRKGVTEQVARTSEELERLRQRQADLEKEKRALQELRQKHDDYTRGKQEMLEQLGEALLQLERDEVRSTQIVDLVASTRRRFKELFEEIEDIDEESWGEDHVGDELTRALTLLEDTRIEFKKSMVKIGTVMDTSERQSGSAGALEMAVPGRASSRSFGQWVKIGFAVSLPMMLLLALLVALYFTMQYFIGYV